MNPSSLHPDPFAMDSLVTTDGDYMASHVTGFPTDDEDVSQQVGGLASMPVTNGVHYHTQQPAMQDLHYSGSSALAMTPPDSVSDSYSPASGSLFPHLNQHQHSYDRMAEYRRMPAALQPPPAMSSGFHTPAHAINSIPALMGQSNAYNSSFGLSRSMVLPLTGMNEVPRTNQYASTPRTLDNVLDRSPSGLFQQPLVQQPMVQQPMAQQALVESTQRASTRTEGPPFEDTNVLETIVADYGDGSRPQVVKPGIQANFGKNFFASEGKWTCYRRNYFAVSCSFSLHPFTSMPLYVRLADQTQQPIRGYAMGISAIVNGQFGDTRELVQHTPKRDKKSERKPAKITLHPTPPPSLTTGSNDGSHGAFGLGSQSLNYNSSFKAATQPTQQPPTSYTFERIQFQKATANNGKRRAQQQFYNLVVELYAEITNPVSGESQWIPIARRHSHPMVVRGRSPGHYKDGRRDSAASMGTDGHRDSVGVKGGLHHGFGQARTLPLMYDSGHRGKISFGRTDYCQITKAEHSPLSDSPLNSSSSSAGFDYSMMNDTMDPIETLKPESTLDFDDSVFAAVSNHHRPSTAGYDPVYSTSSYGRYDPIQNTHGLCT